MDAQSAESQPRLRLSAVRIFVDDLAACLVFYRDVLGLRLTPDATSFGYCSFESGGMHIIVEAVSADAPAHDRALIGRFCGFSFAVDDIAEEYERLRARGVQFTSEPSKQFWGGWLATFRNPARNELQLVQYTQ